MWLTCMVLGHELTRRIERFFCTMNLPPGFKVPGGVTVLNPYTKPEVRSAIHCMAYMYYLSTSISRVGVFGINPGRFGGGLTGIPFIDPGLLKGLLGISHQIHGRDELSAKFMGGVIKKYGGPGLFYSDFFLSALSPIGFTRDGRNLNFYDDPVLLKSLIPVITLWMEEQMAFSLSKRVAVFLGTGKLKHVFEKYLQEHIAVERVFFLEHPRFVMQYRLRTMDDYIQKYIETLRHASLIANSKST